MGRNIAAAVAGLLVALAVVQAVESLGHFVYPPPNDVDFGDPDRLPHQVFGLGITQITSLLARRSVYCSKHATGKHSIAKSFTSDDGNIWFKRLKHTWDGDKCQYCGAAKSVFDRAPGLETHAYAFIHTDNIKTWLAEIFGGNLQF